MAHSSDSSVLEGRNIFVTGGVGSFGRAFIERALRDEVKRVVVFSRDELKQAAMRAELTDPRLRFFLGDVRDQGRLVQAMHGCDTVVHGAAMKRIDSCESDPWEAVQTNILGTHNVASAAIECGVQRAVLLSTDKAPAACTLYGATKFAAERLWIASNVYAKGRDTILSATRYGNVLGSRGSVLGLWQRQRDAGEPLTITSESATRFWMRMSEAVELVRLALAMMRGGEVFIPKIGSAPILHLARAVAERNGQTYAPGHVVTGLRDGERLHETLISDDECAADYGSYFRLGGPDEGPHEMVGGYRSNTNPQQLSVDDLRRMIA